MKNLLILCITGILYSGSVHGQFSYLQGPEVVMDLSDTYQTGEIECVPDSLRDVTINWQLLEISPGTPPEWDFTICDYICYTFFPSQGDGVFYSEQEWLQGDTYKLKLGVSPNGTSGQGTISYFLYTEDAPQEGDTITFHINVQDAAVLETDLEYNLNVQGNRLSILAEGMHEATVFDAQGRTLITQSFENELLTDHLKSGIYFVVIDRLRSTRIIIQ